MPTPFDVLARFLRTSMSVALALLLVVGAPVSSTAQDNGDSTESRSIVVDDFEGHEPGTFPDGWVYVSSNEDILSPEEVMESGEEVVVQEEKGNHFVRLVTEGEALRYTRRNGVDFDWDIRSHPVIKWRWRAHTLPEGASEKEKNDTGGAIYVTFGSDWLGRPKSIKYTYSSTLPVGTVVTYGPLRVIVVDSATEPRLGEWKTVQRNVVDDYRQVFGGRPPDRPVSITLWSDSDTTGDEAKVDIDDITLLPSQR